MGPRLSQLTDFDLDNYLNPFLPASPLSRLPKPISRFLGYRDDVYKEPPQAVIYFWSFSGTVIALLLISAVYRYGPGLAKYNPPVIIASLGASAVLNYNTIRSPLAQPRNTFFGQMLSALVGVAVTKGFQRASNFEDLQWVAGAFCCAAASLVMSITGTIHPPGGATAVLAATNTEIINMGWMFVPFVMLSSAMMLSVACLTNNIQRAYPVYWWTARDLRKKQILDLEKVESVASDKISRGPSLERGVSLADTIVVASQQVHIPESFDLSEEEIALLHKLQGRLRFDFALDDRSHSSDSRPGSAPS